MGYFRWLTFDPGRVLEEILYKCEKCKHEFSSPEPFIQGAENGGWCTRCHTKNCRYVIGPNTIKRIMYLTKIHGRPDFEWFGITIYTIYHLLVNLKLQDYPDDPEAYKQAELYKQEVINFLFTEGFMSRE